MRSGAFGRMAAAILLSALAACGGIRAAPEPPIANFEAYLLGLQQPYAPEAVVACLATPLASQEAKNCRDTIVQALMIAIDLRYAEFELRFFDANRYAGFGATLAALGLSSAGAVVSGGTSQILSAAAAGVTGAREAFRREVLVEQTSGALVTAMSTQRDIVSLRIRRGLQKPATEYPLGVALADVYAYFRAGTIVGGLKGVTQAVGAQREQVEWHLQQPVVGPQSPPPPVGGIGALPPIVPAAPFPPPTPPIDGGGSIVRPGSLPGGAAVRPVSPLIRPGEVVRPKNGAGISPEELVQLRPVFGLTKRNAPRVNAPAFRDAVRSFQQCKNEPVTGVLTPDQKRTALANTDACLATVRTIANPAPQPPPPGTGAQPGPANAIPAPLSPITR